MVMLKFLTENPAFIHKQDCKYDHDEQDKYQGLEIIKCTFSPFPSFCFVIPTYLSLGIITGLQTRMGDGYGSLRVWVRVVF